MPVILQLIDVTKKFGGLRAVSNLTFDVNYGEILAVIGPNGAGKTTVFNLITGFYLADEGKIKYKGKDIVGLPPHKIANLGIARTFQNLRLFRNLTVYENVASAVFSKKKYGIFSAFFNTPERKKITKETDEKTLEILDFFHLLPKIHNIAGALPYGEQRKLELARAIAINPEIILIDEPAAGMNPSEIADFIKLLKNARERFNLTFVLIEHQMELVMSISQRIIVMDFGEKIMEGSPEEVKNDKRVIEAYLGTNLSFEDN